MSCTENDSGNPFLLLFPAVVGCLTLFLARRWASTQVSTTASSTAISRRRKINKDPNAKRPPLATFCKMMAGAKKTAGVSKKVSLPVPEDEVNGGKRVARPTRLPAATAPPPAEVKVAEGPVPPKHVPFPYIPQDGTLLFEAMTFIFTLVTTGLQFLNVYRTNWWLSNSFTTEAMSYYLIDVHLVTFIITIISRRFVLCAAVECLKAILAPKHIPHAIAACRLLVLGVLFSVLMFCLYSMMFKYTIIKILSLLYPAVVYLCLFGFTPGPFMELNTSPPPLHCCFSDPEQIRHEVDTLREDFNMRIKKIVFNSVFEAYYSSFIPCCFAQSYIYYDIYAASQQTVFVWCGTFGRYAAQLLPAALCDTPHRAARHLSAWRRLEPRDGEELSVYPVWSSSQLYAGGARVSLGDAVYQCARHTAAHPASKAHTRFHMVFSNPSSLLCFLLCTQLALILLQICMIASSIAWNNILSIIILLFINYYTLFKLVRDYLIAFKVYRAENLIQDKNCMLQGN